jgi:hypothetical protein
MENILPVTGMSILCRTCAAEAIQMENSTSFFQMGKTAMTQLNGLQDKNGAAVKSTQWDYYTIYHDNSRPSHIVLPIMKKGE